MLEFVPMRPLPRLLIAVFLSLAAGQDVAKDGAVVRGPVGRKAIALVFTGHEYGEGGEAILSALAARGASASFFLTGDFLRTPAFAPLVRRLVAQGHYLGPHSDKHLLYCDWTHRKTLVTPAVFRDDLEANVREIARFGVERTRMGYFLPAYEWCNPEIVGWARERGFVTVNFTPGTRANADYTEDADPRHVSSSDIVESIRAADAADPNGLNGFILLMHIGAGPRRTDKLHDRLPGLLDMLAGRGYRFVRIDELLNR